jgi:hypothetical protein
MSAYDGEGWPRSATAWPLVTSAMLVASSQLGRGSCEAADDQDRGPHPVSRRRQIGDGETEGQSENHGRGGPR